MGVTVILSEHYGPQSTMLSPHLYGPFVVLRHKLRHTFGYDIVVKVPIRGPTRIPTASVRVVLEV